MTEEKMREALEKANCALREASFFVGSHGFLHAAGQLQAVADDVVAALTKQEAGEVSRSQTAKHAQRLLATCTEEMKVNEASDYEPVISVRASTLASLCRAALSLPAPDAGWRDMVLEEAAKVADKWRANAVGAFNATGGESRERNAARARWAAYIADDIRALIPLPAPPVGGGSSLA
jgi:hypothetical protein